MANIQALDVLMDIGISEWMDYAPLSTAELLQRHEISERTFRRHVEEARELGAALRSERDPDDGSYYWHCDNFEELYDELRALLTFERRGFRLRTGTPG